MATRPVSARAPLDLQRIAHDLNNEIALLLGYTELLAVEPAAGPIRPHLDEMRSAGERAKDLVRLLRSGD